MKNYLKNEIKHLPFILIVFVLLYGIVTIATSYQYDSGDIRFDNTGTDLESVNVQDALDETFHHVTDYNEIKTTIGNSTLTTTSQTLTGAINELDDHIVTKALTATKGNKITTVHRNNVFVTGNIVSVSLMFDCSALSQYDAMFTLPVTAKEYILTSILIDGSNYAKTDYVATLNNVTIGAGTSIPAGRFIINFTFTKA